MLTYVPPWGSAFVSTTGHPVTDEYLKWQPIPESAKEDIIKVVKGGTFGGLA